MAEYRVIGVARILCRAHLCSPKKFLVVALTAKHTLKLPKYPHRPDLPNFITKLDSCSVCGAVTTFSFKFAPPNFVLRPGVHVHPVHPGYACV